MSDDAEFDPSKYLRKVSGADYLEVKWRLVWLRTKHPDAELDTELKTNEPDEAVFKATIRIPGGGSASGWGSETAGDFRDFREKAETKAIGRALAALGFGTQFCEDHEFGAGGDAAKVVDTPVTRPARTRQEAPQRREEASPKPAPRINALPDGLGNGEQASLTGFEQTMAVFRERLEAARTRAEVEAVAKDLADAKLPKGAERDGLADLYNRRMRGFATAS